MNKRILLIEDNEQNRYLASFLLQARGWEMVHAEDGPTGVALGSQIDPALILLDIQLPGMDGYAVARAAGRPQAGRHTHRRRHVVCDAW